MSFVYLLCDSGQENCYKIGMTRGKIEKRIKQLQTGNSEEITLLKYHETEYPFFLGETLAGETSPEKVSPITPSKTFVRGVML